MFYCLTFTLRSRVVFTPLVGVCRDEVSGVGMIGRVRGVGVIIIGDGGVALCQSLVFPFLPLGLTALGFLSQPLVTRTRGGRL